MASYVFHFPMDMVVDYPDDTNEEDIWALIFEEAVDYLGWQATFEKVDLDD